MMDEQTFSVLAASYFQELSRRMSAQQLDVFVSRTQRGNMAVLIAPLDGCAGQTVLDLGAALVDRVAEVKAKAKDN